jgi:hypothetical protein
LSAVASKVLSAISLFGWAAAAGDTSDDEAMACPIAPAIDKRPTVVRTCRRLWPSFPLDTEHSCFMTSSVVQGSYGVCDTRLIAAKIAARMDLPIKYQFILEPDSRSVLDERDATAGKNKNVFRIDLFGAALNVGGAGSDRPTSIFSRADVRVGARASLSAMDDCPVNFRYALLATEMARRCNMSRRAI